MLPEPRMMLADYLLECTRWGSFGQCQGAWAP